MPSIEEEIKALETTIKGRFTEIDKTVDELKATTTDAVVGEKVKKLCEAQKADFETRAQKIDERIDQIEAKAKEREGFGSADPMADALKAFDEFRKGFDPTAYGNKHKFDLPVKAVVPITSDTLADNPVRRQGILEVQRPQALRMRDLVAPGTIDGMLFVYEQETGAQGDADYQVNERDTKATYSVATELVNGMVATIAVTSDVSQQTFDDRQAFISFLRARLGYRAERKLDREILDGAGTTGKLTGINTVATAFDPGLKSDTGVTGVQILDIIRLGRLQVELADYTPDGVVVHPLENATMDLLKDDVGRYLVSNPTGSGAIENVFGLPVVSTVGQTQGDFTVGDFRGAAQLLMRQTMTIQASTENKDNFERNMVTLRAELRALLAIYSTLAFVKGTFSTAIAA